MWPTILALRPPLIRQPIKLPTMSMLTFVPPTLRRRTGYGLPKPTQYKMSATAEMPYFVRPSFNLEPAVKRAAYVELRAAAQATLAGETDRVVKQATLACLIKTYLPYAYWAGFYDVKGDRLRVGPYQGTLGCLEIAFGRGVCGRVAVSGKTVIEVDVHALAEGTAHIACDPNSRSEIVVPCFAEANLKADAAAGSTSLSAKPARGLFAVLDIDSSEPGSFDEIDRVELEALLAETFGE